MTSESGETVALTVIGKGKGSPVTVSAAGLKQVEKWAASGLSIGSIASELGVNRSTLASMRKRDENLEEAIGRGRSAQETELVGLLMEKARGGDTIAILFALKSMHGFVEGTQRPGGSISIQQAVIQVAPQMSSEQFEALMSQGSDDGAHSDQEPKL